MATKTLRLSRDQIHHVAKAIVEASAMGQKSPVHTPPAFVIMLQLLITSIESGGVLLSDYAVGAWKVEREGPYGSSVYPAVVREDFALLDHELVEGVAGLLNWCDVPIPAASVSTLSLDMDA